jgi:hypothetical protein
VEAKVSEGGGSLDAEDAGEAGGSAGSAAVEGQPPPPPQQQQQQRGFTEREVAAATCIQVAWRRRHYM